MKVLKINTDKFNKNYLSVAQTKMKLADPTFEFGEMGRGSGKTSHILGARIDRIQNDMPGSTLVLGASTYKAIFDNILPGLLEYFLENYERGIYFEIGKRPPDAWIKRCNSFIADWRHTITFHTGTVVQFVSCDRPESMLGKNAAHLLVDELLKIPEDKFTERIIPALRADRSKFGHSHYFMGITGFSSTPNFETDYDWWLSYEENMNPELMSYIMEIAVEVDKRIYQLEQVLHTDKKTDIEKHKKFIERWNNRLTELRRGQTYYLRASSFSNIKILGLDYIENQVKSIKDEAKLNTSIFSVRSHKVRERFFGRFSKQHIFDDSYVYNIIDTYSVDTEIEQSSRHLKYCTAKMPLYAGLDPGPFMSLIVAQRKRLSAKKEFRIIKNFYVIHPDQHNAMAEKFNEFFKYHQHKELFLHYDRAANQQNPRYRRFYPLSGDDKDSDANLIKKALEKLGWRVHLLSLGQETITHASHYRLLNIIFGKHDSKIDDVLICRNECDELISSINHSPLKITDGAVSLDKSAEKKLVYQDQVLYSPQLATALMYMLYGEFGKFLPEGTIDLPIGSGIFSV